MSYFGVFKSLIESKGLALNEVPFYEGRFSEVYETLCAAAEYDVELYLRQAALTGGDILELACGSGRVSIPLAKAGYNVTGIDLSQDMLSLFEKKLSMLPRRVKSRISIFKGDFLNLSCDKKFKLVILPATTICLVGYTNYKVLFDQIYDVLEEGGRFVFDFSMPPIINTEHIGEMSVIVREDSSSEIKEILFYQEMQNALEKKSLVNFLLERIDKNGITERFLSYTEKEIVNEEDLDYVIGQSDFKKNASYTFGENNLIKFFILEK